MRMLSIISENKWIQLYHTCVPGGEVGQRISFCFLFFNCTKSIAFSWKCPGLEGNQAEEFSIGHWNRPFCMSNGYLVQQKSHTKQLKQAIFWISSLCIICTIPITCVFRRDCHIFPSSTSSSLSSLSVFWLKFVKSYHQMSFVYSMKLICACINWLLIN